MELRSIYKIALFLFVTITLFAILPSLGRWRPSTFSKNKKRFAGVGLMFVKDNKILLVYRDRTEINYNKHGLIGGLVNKNESVERAAIRIANEEVGVIITGDNLQLVHCMSAQQDEGVEVVGFYFVVKNWNGEPFNKASEKHKYIAWFSLDQLPKDLIERNRIAIEAMKKGVLYSEYGY